MNTITNTNTSTENETARLRALIDTAEFDDVSKADVDAMLLREFAQASWNNRKAEMDRLKCRAIDKVMAEMRMLGYTGFVVHEANGELTIEGISK